MMSLNLPQTSEDLLGLPEAEMPDAIRALSDRRALSRLIGRIHRDLVSRDDGLRRQARAALRKMGFPEE